MIKERNQGLPWWSSAEAGAPGQGLAALSAGWGTTLQSTPFFRRVWGGAVCTRTRWRGSGLRASRAESSGGRRGGASGSEPGSEGAENTRRAQKRAPRRWKLAGSHPGGPGGGSRSPRPGARCWLCSGGLRPLVELCVEPAGLCGRCTGVAVPLRVVPSPTGLPSTKTSTVSSFIT